MRKTVLVALVMAVVPACVYAVDGIVLINQATVMAAGGFPYTITQPGSYKLSGNLTTPTNPFFFYAIFISASDVTIDLNGFNISTTGTTPCINCVGILSSDSTFPSGITIRNGSILNFTVPIGLGTLASKRWTLENLILTTSSSTSRTLRFNASTRIWHVSAQDFILSVSCPSVITETVAAAIQINTFGGTGTCAFANNATQ